MSTNDERAMILKMLQEGKISVEEADSLLDVLSETDGDAAGFASAEPVGQTGHRGARNEQRTAFGRPGTPSEPEEPAAREGSRLDFDIDLSGLSEGIQAAVSSIKHSMSGVSESLKHAFEGMGEMTFDFRGGRMGKARTEHEIPLSLDAGGLSRLSIRNPRGDIRVIGSEGATIHGTATVTAWASSEEEAQHTLTDVAVELSEKDGTAQLGTEPGESAERVRVDIEITVPRSLQLEVSAVSGDLWVEDIAAACSIQSVSGDISIANAGADSECDQRIATQSGDIIASSLSGVIDLATASGDITVDEFHGALSATSKSGDIKVVGGDGSVQTQSVSGDVRVELAGLEHGELGCRTVGGDILLAVPQEASLALSAHTLSGEISVDDAFAVTERKRTAVRATLNDGALPCMLSTVSGDLSVAVNR